MPVFRQENDALIWELNHEKLVIQPWGQDSLRVRATRNADVLDTAWALLPPTPIIAGITAGEEEATIRNGSLTAEVTKQGRLRFVRSETQSTLLEEPLRLFYDRPARCLTSVSGELYRAEVRFSPQDGERFYGLGQHKHGFLDQKGCVIPLEQRNTEVNIPFLVSSRGYGLLWNNPAIGRVELGMNGTLWVAEQTRQVDYWITAGDGYAGVLRHYADATGHAPLLPPWAAGFWQCKLRYHTQEELLSVARQYRQRGLPLSVIVADYFHWTQFGDWQFDPACWSDPDAMTRELAEMGVRLMVSVWGTVHRSSVNFRAMEEQGLLLRNERGLPVQTPFGDRDKMLLQSYDATNPAARRFIWERVRDGYYRHGIKVFWLDANEPEIYPIEPDNLRFHIGNGMEVGCIYPMLHEQGFYEGMRAEGEQDVITLCRSAWAGSQRWGAAIRSGDIESTFEMLRAQVRAGLNIGLSGIPWWTTDIGGFHGGNIDSPYFRELVVRWFQYGAFCPLFRLHGRRTDNAGTQEAANEVWSFGEEAYGIIKELLFLRERLQPYIMEQMAAAHTNGAPPMRPLFFDFPADGGCARVDDEFMFGPDLLVAPVLFEGARSRQVYLPAGTQWRDAWTGKHFEGGQSINAAAPLDTIPLYVRGERQLPIKL